MKNCFHFVIIPKHTPFFVRKPDVIEKNGLHFLIQRRKLHKNQLSNFKQLSKNIFLQACVTYVVGANILSAL